MTEAVPPPPSIGREPAQTYSAVAVALHWIIAALIISNVGLAWISEELSRETRIQWLGWHKTIGITILLLSLARLGWRLTHKPPPLNPHLKRWEKLLAHIAHWGFYVLMIALPLSGWAMVSASPLIKVYPIHFYIFDWPAISFLTDLPRGDRMAAQELLLNVHELLAKPLIYVLFPLHVLGALKHQFLDKDNELARMIPFLRRGG